MGLPCIKPEDNCPKCRLEHYNRSDDQRQNRLEPFNRHQIHDVDGERGGEQDPGEVETEPGEQQLPRPQEDPRHCEHVGEEEHHVDDDRDGGVQGGALRIT